MRTLTTSLTNTECLERIYFTVNNRLPNHTWLPKKKPKIELVDDNPNKFQLEIKGGMWGIYINILTGDKNTEVDIVRFIPFVMVVNIVAFGILVPVFSIILLASNRIGDFVVLFLSMLYFVWYFHKYISVSWKVWTELIEKGLTEELL